MMKKDTKAFIQQVLIRNFSTYKMAQELSLKITKIAGYSQGG